MSGKGYLKAGCLQSLSVPMSSLVSALRTFQRLAEEQPVTLPEATVDLGEDKKRKRKAPKKVHEAVKKRKNLTLDLKPKETSEHVEFDVDAFLDSIPRPPPEQEPQCPRCMTDLTMGSTRHEDGSQWEYYRCPMTRFNTKCNVTCGKENLAAYLKAVDEQTHPVYAQIAPEKFKCACDLSMILVMSQSEKNPGRLYLKCPKRSCKLLQLINEPPQGLA